VATKPNNPSPSKSTDPLDINGRLYKQIGRLLDDLESADRDEVMTTPQRISALIAVGRILTIFASLRKGDYDYGNSGSAVRKYAAAFARPDAARGGKNPPRSTNIVEFDRDGDDDGDDAA
jgi:hypothetical protein